MKRSSSLEWLGQAVEDDTSRVIQFQRFCGVKWLDEPVEVQRKGAVGSCNDLLALERRARLQSGGGEEGRVIQPKNSIGGGKKKRDRNGALRRRGSAPSRLHAAGVDHATMQDSAASYGEQAGSRRRRHSNAHLLLHIMFRIGAFFGEELFYISFLPNLGWTISFSMTRQLLAVMCIMYFVGQLLKDTLKLPRPPSPPVVRLESHFAEEYGLPSTHAMGAVCVPFFLAYSLTPSFETFSQIALSPVPDAQSPFAFLGITPMYWSLVVLWVVACWWFTTMTLSRLYMGVHSIPDLIAGFALGALFLVLGILFAKDIDDFLITHPYGGAVAVACTILSAAIYAVVARPNKWTPCFGDTTLIISVGCGVTLGTRLADPVLHYSEEVSASMLLPIAFDCADGVKHALFGGRRFYVFVLVWLVRSIVAYTLLLLIRVGVKTVAEYLIKTLLLVERPERSYSVEIPTKIITYTTVGLCATALVPRLPGFGNW